MTLRAIVLLAVGACGTIGGGTLLFADSAENQIECIEGHPNCGERVHTEKMLRCRVGTRVVHVRVGEGPKDIRWKLEK